MNGPFYLKESGLNSSSAVLRVVGPDANTYLQGQFTQDLRISSGAVAYGLWLDQKGRIQGDSHLLKRAENDWLVASFSMPAGKLRERLEAYLIADEVELIDESATWAGLLVWGGPATPTPPPGGVDLPSRRAGPNARQWLVPAAAIESAIAALGATAVSVDRDGVARERLRAAIPAVPDDLGARDLPQEGNLDDGAISYTKGCYLGQEVMARLKNLGQVRRALHLVRGEGAPPPSGGMLFQGEQKVGELRTVVGEGDGFLAMAMLSLVNLKPAPGLALAAGSAPSIRIIRRV